MVAAVAKIDGDRRKRLDIHAQNLHSVVHSAHAILRLLLGFTLTAIFHLHLRCISIDALTFYSLEKARPQFYFLELPSNTASDSLANRVIQTFIV